jgi:hypothetical protein
MSHGNCGSDKFELPEMIIENTEGDYVITEQGSLEIRSDFVGCFELPISAVP